MRLVMTETQLMTKDVYLTAQDPLMGGTVQVLLEPFQFVTMFVETESRHMMNSVMTAILILEMDVRVFVNMSLDILVLFSLVRLFASLNAVMEF